MERNVRRLRRRLDQLGAPLRPHLKTAKSIEVARRVVGPAGGPITVSTLREAEYFAAYGITDILYAVGIAPSKLGRVMALRAQGIDLTVVVDSKEAAASVAAASRAAPGPIPTLIEIDTDGHRAGVPPASAALIEVGRVLHRGGADVRGVIAHAGTSYHARGPEALRDAAERERTAAVASAAVLAEAGLPCTVVSVGSTPTAHFARDLTGVTEVRAGNFVFFDLFMAGLGVCALHDIALSVSATVVGHQGNGRQIIIDAGWTAVSRDRATARQPVDWGYGMVCDVDGVPYEDVIVAEVSQEHGILAARPGSSADVPRLGVRSLVRILPNHACAMAAQHGSYQVVRNSRIVHEVWHRISGW